jgi:hypothetical protein
MNYQAYGETTVGKRRRRQRTILGGCGQCKLGAMNLLYTLSHEARGNGREHSLALAYITLRDNRAITLSRRRIRICSKSIGEGESEAHPKLAKSIV